MVREAGLLAQDIDCFQEQMGIPFVSTIAPARRKTVRFAAPPPFDVETRTPTLMSIPEHLDLMTDALTVKEVYTLLHMDRCTTYDHIRSGQIASFWAGNRLRVDPHHLAAYVRSRESLPAQKPGGKWESDASRCSFPGSKEAIDGLGCQVAPCAADTPGRYYRRIRLVSKFPLVS
jgi:hypothetical protein